MSRKPNAASLGIEEEDNDTPSLPKHLQSSLQEHAPASALQSPRESAADAAARIRREREEGTRPRNISGYTQKLQVYGEIPGYHLAIVNDDKNRCQELEATGWLFVRRDEIKGVNSNVTSYNNDPGDLVRFAVGTKENGEPLYGYLMKLPEEIWQDDQAFRAAHDAKVDSQILRGKVPGETDEDREERYTNPFKVKSTMTTKVTPSS